MRYRKKPVVIEAMRVPPPTTDDNIGAHGYLAGWLQHVAKDREWQMANGSGEIDIFTLEGTMRANNGDWIICGVQGEIYPCKHDIFEATYEPAD